MLIADVADELYGLPPEQFTEVRNERAKEIATWDRDLASEVRKLPKPTVAAWLANALVRTHTPTVKELISLGPALREAQSRRRREDMRRITDRRRALIRELVGAASQSAAQAGHSMGLQVQQQLEETLEAAVADDGSAALLRAGRLSSPLAFIGFGGGSTSTQSPAARTRGVRSKTTSSRANADEERQAAERALTNAAESLSAAQRTMKSAKVSVEEARRRHNEASVRHRAATKELREADRGREKADQDLESAIRTRAEAERYVREATREHKSRLASLHSLSE